VREAREKVMAAQWPQQYEPLQWASGHARVAKA